MRTNPSLRLLPGALLAALPGALLAACAPDFTLRDGEAAPAPPTLRDRYEDGLSRNYVVGTQVRLYIEPHGAVDTSRWWVRSDNAAVFRVDRMRDQSDSGLKARIAECTALAPGAAELRIVDEREVVRAKTPVAVDVPDRATLYAQAQLRLSGLGPDAEVREARILVGGKGVFGVAYFRGAQRLFGSGVLEREGGAGLLVENPTSEFMAINDWLYVTPQAEGGHTLRLSLRGAELARLAVTAVPEAEVASLALVHQRRLPQKQDEVAYVLARVSDRGGREILGAYSDWTLGGVPQGEPGPAGAIKPRPGDLFRYEHSGSAPVRLLAARRGALAASLETPIQTSSAKVTDTTYLGCSAAPGGRPGAGAALLAALPLLAVLRRRRAAA